MNNRKEKYFIYLDPPYYHNSEKLYHNTYKEEDHEKLSVFLKKNRNFFWILSYDDCTEIKTLYSRDRKIKFNVNYSLNKKRSGQELMIFDKKIKLTKRTLEELKQVP